MRDGQQNWTLGSSDWASRTVVLIGSRFRRNQMKQFSIQPVISLWNWLPHTGAICHHIAVEGDPLTSCLARQLCKRFLVTVGNKMTGETDLM